MRRPALLLAAALVALFVLPSSAFAHDCSSFYDCLETAGFNGFISVVGGIIGVVTGIIGTILGGAGGNAGNVPTPGGRPGDAKGGTGGSGGGGADWGDEGLGGLGGGGGSGGPMQVIEKIVEGGREGGEWIGGTVGGLVGGGGSIWGSPGGGFDDGAPERFKPPEESAGNDTASTGGGPAESGATATGDGSADGGPTYSDILTGTAAIDTLVNSGLVIATKNPDGTTTYRPGPGFDELGGDPTSIQSGEAIDPATGRTTHTQSTPVHGVTGIAGGTIVRPDGTIDPTDIAIVVETGPDDPWEEVPPDAPPPEPREPEAPKPPEEEAPPPPESPEPERTRPEPPIEPEKPVVPPVAPPPPVEPPKPPADPCHQFKVRTDEAVAKARSLYDALQALKSRRAQLEVLADRQRDLGGLGAAQDLAWMLVPGFGGKAFAEKFAHGATDETKKLVEELVGETIKAMASEATKKGIEGARSQEADPQQIAIDVLKKLEGKGEEIPGTGVNLPDSWSEKLLELAYQEHLKGQGLTDELAGSQAAMFGNVLSGISMWQSLLAAHDKWDQTWHEISLLGDQLAQAQVDWEFAMDDANTARESYNDCVASLSR